MRNITNDDLNEEYYSPTTRKLKMLLSLAASMFIIGIVIALVFAIFTLKVIIYKFKSLKNLIFINNNKKFIMILGLSFRIRF